MCDERERLIEYVYGEVTAAQRQQIDDHLADCHVCRAEVGGLRSVREDLLAWDVPKHDPVWRPVAQVPVQPARPRWPVWGLASAAGVVFAAGLAAGVAARGWTADPAPAGTLAVAAVSTPAVGPVQPVAVTADDLSRLEAVILDRVRAEMAEQLRTLAPGAGSAVRVTARPVNDDFEERLVMIEQLLDDQISLNNLFNSRLGSLNRSTSVLSEQIELSRLQRVGFEGGVR